MNSDHKWAVRDHVREWVQEQYQQLKAEREGQDIEPPPLGSRS